jgi:hypothetical protein
LIWSSIIDVLLLQNKSAIAENGTYARWHHQMNPTFGV